MVAGVSGSMNYSAASGSWYDNWTDYIPVRLRPQITIPHDAFKLEHVETVAGDPQELTIKYFQRVYDAGTAGYCYYTDTSIDPSPASASTIPPITGIISDHSIIKILEIY